MLVPRAVAVMVEADPPQRSCHNGRRMVPDEDSASDGDGRRVTPGRGQDTGARGLALRLLQSVLRHRLPLDQAVERQAAWAQLAPRDRAFTRLLVVTMLRRLGQLDALIAQFVPRRLPAKLAPVHDILRLGLAQLLFLDTPPHAAVDSAVVLARQGRFTAHAGLVNAVLRRAVSEAPSLLDQQDAARLNTPGWLWRRWRARFGEPAARAIAAAHMREPPLDITAAADTDVWAERLDAVMLPTGTLRRAVGGAVADLPGYDAGAWWVQDAAASLPARLLGDVGGERVLDLCAAPGGKTAQLAAAGARVTALDNVSARLQRLRDNLGRLHLEVETIRADATEFAPPRPFPLVLLDAPCTGTGTIRRHPDIARLKRAADIAVTASLQQTLLEAAAGMVAAGGCLVYAVCSLEPEEGPQQVDRFLDGQAGWRRAPIEAEEIGGVGDAITPAGDLQTLPCQHDALGGWDGFYAARLRRG